MTLYHGLFRHTKPEATLLAGAPLLLPWADMDRSRVARTLETVLGGQLESHRSRVLNHQGYMPDEFRPLLRRGDLPMNGLTCCGRAVGEDERILSGCNRYCAAPAIVRNMECSAAPKLGAAVGTRAAKALPAKATASSRALSLSVLIPARDEADNIGDCLSSVMASNTGGIGVEIIVLDDSSTDGTGLLPLQRAAEYAF